VRGSVAVPHGHMEALTGPGLKPQIGVSRSIVLGQSHPVAGVIGGKFPKAAGIARKSNSCRSTAKPPLLNIPIWITIRRTSRTDIVLPRHFQIQRFQCPRFAHISSTTLFRFIRGSVAIPHLDMEALTGPRLKPQIGVSRSIVLGQNHPIRPIEGTLPKAAGIARDTNPGRSSAKPVQLN